MDQMKKNSKKTYVFTGEVTISVYTTIEAESFKEALEIAEEKDKMDIFKDGYFNEKDFWVADELDGEVQNIKLAEQMLFNI